MMTRIRRLDRTEVMEKSKLVALQIAGTRRTPSAAPKAGSEALCELLDDLANPLTKNRETDWKGKDTDRG